MRAIEQQPTQYLEIITDLTTSFQQVRNQRRFCQVEDLPAHFHIGNQSEFVPQAQFEINFFVQSLELYQRVDELLALRESLGALIAAYKKQEMMLLQSKNYENSLLYNLHVQKLEVLYRVYSLRLLQSSLNSNKFSINHVRRAAIRLVLPYSQLASDGKQTEHLEHLSDARKFLLSNLQDTTMFYPAEVTHTAEYQSWATGAAALFLSKIPGGEAYLVSPHNPPIFPLLELIRTALRFSDVNRITLQQAPRTAHRFYTVSPRVTNPLENISVVIPENPGPVDLHVTDLFTLQNAFMSLFKAKFTELENMLGSSTESRESSLKFIGFLERVLEVQLFCVYSLLHREFSIENCFAFLRIIEDGVKLESATGRRVTIVLRFKSELLKIMQLINRTNQYIDKYSTQIVDTDKEKELLAEINRRLVPLQEYFGSYSG